MGNYTIERGDTLSGIARANNTTVSDLMKANPSIKDANKIYAGNTLSIPGKTSYSSPSSSGSYGTSYGTSTGVSYTGASGSKSSGRSGYSSGYGGDVGAIPTVTSYGGYTPTQTSGYKTVTNYTYDKFGNPIAFSGLEKVGTNYDAASGYLEHASGYTGQAYKVGNRYYTPYGALIREDNHFYPEGAVISANGMYYDTGGGWQYSGYGTQGSGVYNWSHSVPTKYTSASPGSSGVMGWDRSVNDGVKTVLETPAYMTQAYSEPMQSTRSSERVYEEDYYTGSEITPYVIPGADEIKVELDDVFSLTGWTYENERIPEWERYTRSNRGF